VQLSKRIATLVVCVLGLAILSNRNSILRQFTVAVHPIASFHSPFDKNEPVQAARGKLLFTLPNEEVFDAQVLSRDPIAGRGHSAFPFGAARASFTLHTEFLSTTPTYILQSALNL
jgi:hypothetical protein